MSRRIPTRASRSCCLTSGSVGRPPVRPSHTSNPLSEPSCGRGVRCARTSSVFNGLHHVTDRTDTSFRLWMKDGTWKRVQDALPSKVRQAQGREHEPTIGIMDSQSVKASEEADRRGYDAGKQMKGRKRHLLVAVLGLVLVAWVTTTDVQDRDAAAGAVLPRASEDFPSLNKVWADAGYQGPVVADAAKQAGLAVEIVRRAEEDTGFVVQKRRWVVERTNAWLTRQRRLARDYERHEHSSETLIHIAMTGLMLRRLA
ncbi:IS5 family transposase [Corallococcus sp. RDP092CA]|uniref:IS5 family transposase n=1 Tax=Corallococcus sp. RDP092CA TaxID=3109369 RepID=UPI0035B165C8